MEKQPLLSIIVPVYNTGRYLSRCFDSLKGQTYGNLEIILVDDGATDDSPAMCDRFAQDYENVRVLHKKNAGLGYARNSGLDMATGEYVAFLDSDDYVHPDMYRSLMEAVENSGADAAFCDFSIVRRDGKLEPMESSLAAGQYTGKDILLAILGAAPEAKRDFDFDMSVWKAVYSRKLIEEYGLRFVSERELISEDLFFQLDFLRKTERVEYIKEKLYYYCENDGSLTHRYIANRLEREKVMFHEICSRAGDLLRGENTLRWHRLFLGRVRMSLAQQVFYDNDGNLFARLRIMRRIAMDETVRTVIESYPIGRNPVKLRIFNTFLKWRFCAGMYMLIALKR